MIVVDDGSSQDVRSVVADFEVDFVALDRNEGLSSARNAGIALSRAPIIAFTDDDVIVPPDWCERLLQAWRAAPEETRAIGGEVTVSEIGSMTQRYLAQHNPLSPIDLEIAPGASFLQRLRVYAKSDSESTQPVRHVYSLVGANMSFTRVALADVGGFDPSIRFGGDEEHVCKQIRRLFGDSIDTLLFIDRGCPRIRSTTTRYIPQGISLRLLEWANVVPRWRRAECAANGRGLFMVSLIVAAPFSILGAVLFALLIPFSDVASLGRQLVARTQSGGLRLSPHCTRPGVVLQRRILCRLAQKERRRES